MCDRPFISSAGLFEFEQGKYSSLFKETFSLIESLRIEEATFDIPPKFIKGITLPIMAFFNILDSETLTIEQAQAYKKQIESKGILYIFDTESLRLMAENSGSSLLIDALNKKPLTLYIIFDGNNLYFPPPTHLEKAIVQIGTPLGLSEYIDNKISNIRMMTPYTIDDYLHELMYAKKGRRNKAYRYGFTLERIHSSIAHELAHWLSDTMHNNHIGLPYQKSRIKKKDTESLEKSREKFYKVINMEYSHVEIDAVIHAIKQAKENFTDAEWNKMEFKDLCTIYSTLYAIISPVLQSGEGLDYLENYLIRLTKRMHREHLLGTNMEYWQVFTEPDEFSK